MNDRLKSIREMQKKGLSQQAIATHLNISYNRAKDLIQQAKGQFYKETLIRLVKCLDKSVLSGTHPELRARIATMSGLETGQVQAILQGLWD